MHSIVSLVLRRMRQPLLTLIVVYTVVVLGMVLIPGRDADGNIWHMDIFHAFYFVSFMATTIGFGEIPHEFTDAQRLWVLLSIYATVISWIYALGTILTLVQDRSFQQAIAERRFARHIESLKEPFFLICGYGQTGAGLVRTLIERGQHAVVIDVDADRINMLGLDDLREFVPGLHADVRRPLHLKEAGIEHPNCAGVVALTNDNAANLKVAITTKLLHPGIRVICRADSHDVEANMASFGTDHIIDPFDTFGTYLATAFQAPCLYLMHRWLSDDEYAHLDEPVYPPKEGHWIVCGYGRFGKPIVDRLKREGLSVVVVEAKPESTGEPEGGCVVGRGTEASTLHEAGITTAVGLVAGTNSDANNLSIIMTAREINDDIFVVVRQNHLDNTDLTNKVGAAMVMHPSTIIADRIRVLLATPLLYEFFSLALHEDDAWDCQLVSRISALIGNHVPMVREININEDEALAVVNASRVARPVTIEHVMCDPWGEREQLPAILLLVVRRNDRYLLPGPEFELKPGDRLLVCGNPEAFPRMRRNLQQSTTLTYVQTGKAPVQGWLWSKVKKTT